MTRSRIASLVRSSRNRLRYRTQPAWIAPMLATLTEDLPTGGHWIYEPKLDGVRGLAFVSGGSVHLYSRNRKPLDSAYPELVEALSTAVRGDAVLDGEIVAPDRHGRSSFARLQQRMQLRDPVRATRTGVKIQYYVFDCLFYEGIDLTGMPLVDRKAVLRDVVWFDGPIRFTPFRTSGSAAMLRDACAKGAEGIIAKRADSRYQTGVRSADWLKIKCVRQQEFVVGGYTPPQGSRERLGALLVGYYDDGALRYAGKVGTGYNHAALELLYQRLRPLHRKVSPFAPGPLPSGPVHWVAPQLVVQVGFSEWTEAGLLRHPRYLGLRDDKSPLEVVREA